MGLIPIHFSQEILIIPRHTHTHTHTLYIGFSHADLFTINFSQETLIILLFCEGFGLYNIVIHMAENIVQSFKSSH